MIYLKIVNKFNRNPTPPVKDWGIARSLRSLGRISECIKIKDFWHNKILILLNVNILGCNYYIQP